MPRRHCQSAGGGRSDDRRAAPVEDSQKATCECRSQCQGIGPTEFVRCPAMTASMTAADLVAGILQKTGGMPVRALIGHHRLISLTVLLLKGSRVGPRRSDAGTTAGAESGTTNEFSSDDPRHDVSEGVKVPHRPIDQHVEVLPRRVQCPLRGSEVRLVGIVALVARAPAEDRLAEWTGPLGKGDLKALRGRWMARDAAALVGGDAGPAGGGPPRECPGRAGRVVPGPDGTADTCARLLVTTGTWPDAWATTTRSMRAVLLPPAVPNPWNVIVCDPGLEIVNEAVVSFQYEVLPGVMVSTNAPSTSTWKPCCDWFVASWATVRFRT